MRIDISRLRFWFAAATIAVVLVVAGFYFYARYRYYHAVKEIPQKLGIEVQQSTESFSLSKSEGGKTLFTIRASKAVQYKHGGRAELRDVSILVYGRDSNRFDQIYGAAFEYDPQSGNVVAKGEVHIDLEANALGQIAPHQMPPPELKNPIHVKTSGLIFNQKSGIAKTDERVEFRIPQASGSAVGATYDSKTNTLTLVSRVELSTTGESAANVTAEHGTLTKEPRQAVLHRVLAKRGESTMAANKVNVTLRHDNTIDRVLADGDVRMWATGETEVAAKAPHAEIFLTGKNVPRAAAMSGGVALQAAGAHNITGNAGRVDLDFGPDSKLNKVRASKGVRLLEKASGGSQGASAGIVDAALRSSPGIVRDAKGRNRTQPRDNIELTADAVDFYVRNGKMLDRAETTGAAQITIVPGNSRSPERSTITAGKFNAGFQRNRLTLIHGAPNARIVQSVAGQPDKVSTSDSLDATFAADGTISGFVQQGSFAYRESGRGGKVERSASANKATYSNLTQVLVLQGSPRVVEGGMAASARTISLNRRTGDAEAEYDVKTTYSELEPQPSGALLASAAPVHVTAATMTLKRATGVARFSGNARLWQAANIVQAPIIVFDRDKRALQAEGNENQQVSTVLVQPEKSGKTTPVSIVAARLTYADKQRKARFEGNVLVRSADGSMTADHIDAFLKPRQSTGAATTTPSELDRIVAEGHIVVQQPTRRATGAKLVYSAENGKFVLTGGPPTIIDAERGTITGGALTFYSRDDRVLVEGGDQGRTVTTTRVSK
ncbi:MAG TPA: LPS export ABC transporter periplasmic protein LptC [Terriglobales bacterium]|nr:LPS export ABC transporter periplasmic protein LptC [Terriglobales bacterium]